jgi:predicted phosphodiesterase
MENKELFDKIKYLIKKKKSFVEICKALELKDYEVIGLVNLMKENGELVDYFNGEIIKLIAPVKQSDVYQVNYNNEKLRLLLLSDTHLASKYDRLDILRYLYEKADSRGIKHILHSGDFTDGRSNRPEHVYELKELSYEGQVQYCVDNYPHFNGKTYTISGNHDDWWYKSAGSEIVKSIAKQRDDIIYLGADTADLTIGKIKIRLFHGKGGNAYARSYKLQKYIDAIPLEERPDILQAGHIHQSFYMKQDHTHCFQTSCLEDLTPFGRAQGFANDKSIWWVDIELDDKGQIHNVSQELETFNEGKRLVKRK